MPEYRAPGVYVQETVSSPRPIAGVDTAGAAFIGAAAQGPSDTATSVTSGEDFEHVFGRGSAAMPLGRAVRQFFANGGENAVIVRVAPADADQTAAAISGDSGRPSGIHALLEAPLPGLVLVPDAAYFDTAAHARVTADVLAFCERHKLFHIADVPRDVAGKQIATVAAWAENTVSHSPCGAVYFPWLRTKGAAGRAKKPGASVPPAGAAAGVYARTDLARGVWKAPAGIEADLLDASATVPTLSPADQNLLHGVSVNAIRSEPGRGLFLWGARTLLPAASAGEWAYVPTKRFALFLERSLAEDLRWAVFEPNDEPLWAQIRLATSSFFYQLFRAGAFSAARPQEAYFVKCGRDTMTQADIDAGRLILAVGFAPMRPAEFIVLTIALKCAPQD